jgi:hypothetical protein
MNPGDPNTRGTGAMVGCTKCADSSSRLIAPKENNWMWDEIGMSFRVEPLTVRLTAFAKATASQEAGHYVLRLSTSDCGLSTVD